MEKKKKNISPKLNRWLFLAVWTAIHAITWGAAVGLYNLLTAPLSHFEQLIFILDGVLPGITLSIPTYWLIKRFKGITIQWWRPTSFVAWLIGVLLSLYFYAYPFPLIQVIFWFAPAFLVQSWLLRKHVRHSWLWFLAGLTSAILFLFAGAEDEVTLTWALSGALQGLLTGMMIVALFAMPQQEKSKHTQAQDDSVLEQLSDMLEDADYRLEDGTQSASSASL